MFPTKFRINSALFCRIVTGVPRACLLLYLFIWHELILCSRVSQVASLGLRLFSDPGGILLPFPTLRDSVRAMQNHGCWKGLQWTQLDGRVMHNCPSALGHPHNLKSIWTGVREKRDRFYFSVETPAFWDTALKWKHLKVCMILNKSFLLPESQLPHLWNKAVGLDWQVSNYAPEKFSLGRDSSISTFATAEIIFLNFPLILHIWLQCRFSVLFFLFFFLIKKILEVKQKGK